MTMRRLTTLFMAFLLVVSAILCPIFSLNAYAQTPQTDNLTLFSTYNILLDFVSSNPTRVAYTQDELKAAQYLADEFKALNYDVSLDKFVVDDKNSSQNVVAVKKSSTSNVKQLIFGAHYDNVKDGQGAYDNGSGIAVLIDIATRIKDLPLNYDVVFVAFGAEEPGMYGSAHYAGAMSRTEIDNTALLINIDSVSAGDHLYFYGEDVRTDYNDFFVKMAKGNAYSVDVRSKPLGLDIITVLQGYSVAPYYQTAQLSDHSSFRKLGIPTEFVFSGNYFSKYVGYVETADNGKSVMHTANDTIDNLTSTYGDLFAKKMQTVSDTFVKSLTESDFSIIVNTAKSELVSPFWFNDLYAYLIPLVLLVLLVLFGNFYLKKLRKQAILNTPEIKKGTIIDKPDADDIYTFLK